MSTEKESEHTHTYTGRVKWFNNKAGYGFISITDGEKAGNDVFVHHSNVLVSSEQYKYLVQGEYVSFSMVRVEGDKHEFQAHNVTGVNGGTLMCETRYQQRVERSTYRKNKTQENEQEQNQWNYVSRVKKGNHESKPTETQAPREKQPPMSKPRATESKPRATESKPENQEKKKRGRPPSKKQTSAN